MYRIYKVQYIICITYTLRALWVNSILNKELILTTPSFDQHLGKGYVGENLFIIFNFLSDELTSLIIFHSLNSHKHGRFSWRSDLAFSNSSSRPTANQLKKHNLCRLQPFIGWKELTDPPHDICHQHRRRSPCNFFARCKFSQIERKKLALYCVIIWYPLCNTTKCMQCNTFYNLVWYLCIFFYTNQVCF